jgi:hypothetical protein
MKKVIIGIYLFMIVTNAEMTNVEKGFAQGLGVGYAQLISMENPNYDVKNSFNLCMKKIDLDSNIKSRSDESVKMALQECVSQLINIKAN